MANQNLSQFGEKLFVADADHTFIWDTAAFISKRVSRNSWLNSGTLTSDAPVTISQTWNNAAVAFTGLKFNAVSTASAAGSLLLDFQVSGVSQVSVRKDGALTALGSAYLGSLNVGNAIGLSAAGGNIRASNGISINLGAADSTSADNFANLFLRSSAIVSFGGNTKILRDDADNTLALRNGAAAQTFRVYNTYTDASSYERGYIRWQDNILKIETEAAGSGISNRSMAIGAGGQIGFYSGTGWPIFFVIGGVQRWSFSAAGNLIAAADNTYDIGASGANRPRNVYVGNSVVVGSSNGLSGGITTDVGVGRGIIFGNRGQLSAIADGHFNLVDFVGTGFNRFSYGGTTSGYPALKRVGAELQIVIASTTSAAGVAAPDADLTFIEDRYRRKGAGTPEGVVTAPIGAVYHNTTGGAGTSLYVKESGTGNTGWVGK